jgi:hypothetical protein
MIVSRIGMTRVTTSSPRSYAASFAARLAAALRARNLVLGVSRM